MDTVESLLGLRDKTPIEAVTAIVKKVWPLEPHDTGNFGPWTSQNIILTDGRNEITAGFVSRDEIPADVEGKTMLLRSITSTQHGLVGLKTKMFRNTIQLSVTKTAEVEVVDEGEAGDSAPVPAPARRPAPAPARPAPPVRPAAPAARPAPSAVTPAGQFANTKDYLNRAANVMELCLDAANYVRSRFDRDNGGDGTMSAEQFQAITSSFFIAAHKDGYVDAMPIGNLDDFKTPLTA